MRSKESPFQGVDSMIIIRKSYRRDLSWLYIVLFVMTGALCYTLDKHLESGLMDFPPATRDLPVDYN
jgi:hypothetical protein